MKEPTSMDECVYFTRRVLGEGSIVAWAHRKECPKCKKGIMGKPRDPKTGKPKIRTKEYTCYECGFTEEEKEHFDSLDLCVKYVCPKCKHNGEMTMPFIRKKVMRLDEESGKKQSVEAFVVLCEKCGEKMLVTKKMK